MTAPLPGPLNVVKIMPTKRLPQAADPQLEKAEPEPEAEAEPRRKGKGK
jgi:hypothetical protein